MIRELCRAVVPGGQDADWVNFSIATVSLLTEFIPGFGQGANAIIAPSKTALRVINQLMEHLRLIARAGGPAARNAAELSQFLATKARHLTALLLDARFDDLKRLVIDDGLAATLFYLVSRTDNVVATPFWQLANPSAMLVANYANGLSVAQKLEYVSELARVRGGIESFGRTMRQFTEAGDNVVWKMVPTDQFRIIADNIFEAGAKVAAEQGGRHADVVMSNIVKSLDSVDKAVLNLMREELNPTDLARVISGMANVFAHSDVSPELMNTLLRRKEIFSLKAVAPGARVMTLPQMLENAGLICTHKIEGAALYLRRLAQNNSAAGIQGTRYELDLVAEEINRLVSAGRHADISEIKIGTDLVFPPRPNLTTKEYFKRKSDVDGVFKDLTVNAKRRASTANGWVSGYSRKKVIAYLERSMKIHDKPMQFYVGELNANPSRKLRKIAEDKSKLFADPENLFKLHEILPPPPQP